MGQDGHLGITSLKREELKARSNARWKEVEHHIAPWSCPDNKSRTGARSGGGNDRLVNEIASCRCDVSAGITHTIF